ncbi:hydrogenase maturation protease [Chloroflexota bacterium]
MAGPIVAAQHNNAAIERSIYNVAKNTIREYKRSVGVGYMGQRATLAATTPVFMVQPMRRDGCDQMRTIILGLGNPILSDDGVGLRVARELEGRVSGEAVEVVETGMAGLYLLDLMASYDRAIIVDAVQTEGGEPGRVYRLSPEALDVTRNAALPHDVHLATALELGRRLDMPLPREIVIFAIEVADSSTFGEELTPEATEAVPLCVDMIIGELNGGEDA